MRRGRAPKIAVLVALVAAPVLAQSAVLVAGAPAAPLSIPAAPTLRLTIETATELQIDAVSVTADPEIALLRDGEVMAIDSDGGEGLAARIVTFVSPGDYDVAVWEWHGGALEAHVTATALAPLPLLGTITLGSEAVRAEAPAGDSVRNASAEVALTIAEPGEYRIDAVGPESGCNPELVLFRDGAELARDADGGDGNDARFEGSLEPGSYRIRVHDWMRRACAILVSASEAR